MQRRSLERLSKARIRSGSFSFMTTHLFCLTKEIQKDTANPGPRRAIANAGEAGSGGGRADGAGMYIQERIVRVGAFFEDATLRMPMVFAQEIVTSLVGFADGPDARPVTRKPTTKWPIQNYLWSDFLVSPKDEVTYRVAPMADQQTRSWIRKIETLHGAPRRDQLRNRRPRDLFLQSGIVAGQWLALCCGKIIRRRSWRPSSPHRTTRSETSWADSLERNSSHFLPTPMLRKRYAALFELNNPEMIPLFAFRNRAQLVLGNGGV